MMQYELDDLPTNATFRGIIARLAEEPSTEVLTEVLGEAAAIVGATGIVVSSREAAGARARVSSELRVRITGTSDDLIASFDEPPSPLDIERLQLLASAVSLALRYASQKREAERARFHVTLGRAVSGVLHDIANPLNALLLCIESARDGVETRDCIEDALQSATLIRTALERLRRFTSGLDREASVIEVDGAITSSVRVASFATRGLAEVVVNVAPDLHVRARPGELEHVLVNLLINAAHALADEGTFHHRITVSASANRGDVVIDVHDTGPGIAPKDLERLFEEGFTTKSASVGSGLGLSICREIVTELGGSIEFKVPSGRGTRVTVRLPAAPAPVAADGAPDADELAPALPRVLIVDSDDLVTRTLGRALERVAIVRTTTAVDDAMALVREEPFDLVVCEHTPSRVDGLALRRAHADRWPERAARVALSIVDPCVSLPEGTRLITKPIDLGALKALVAEATPQRVAARHTRQAIPTG